jgi:hypothetical protein
MTEPISLTGLIAIYGAVLSSIALGRNLYRDLLDRPHLSLVSQSGCFDASQAEHASACRRREATCLAYASGLRAARH